MIKINRYLSRTVLAVLVLVFLGTSARAAEEGTEPVLRPVADELIGASGITWSPKVNYSELVLTISRPDGTFFRTSFASGSSPYVGLSSIMGDKNTDGSYTYELRVIPAGSRKARQEAAVDTVSQARSQSHKALTQSGHFVVRGGAIVTPGEQEAMTGGGLKSGAPVSTSSSDDISRTADVCYADDLIVDGSLCVGFDCVCNYSFGFDTIALKENNLRIFFDDTSTTGSFPRNDWRIIINDSANGGASYFGVEDSTGGRRVFTLEAGAPSHSLFVDDGGRVGFGTSTPVVDLHAVSGNTPTLRLEQDGSSGFSPQTWDVAGNETSFFIRDATNGSQLPFRIRPGADSNTLVIDSDNDVGIGILSPSYPLHVKTNSSTNAEILAERTSGAQAQLGAAASLAYFGARTDHEVRFQVNSDWRMRLNPTSNSRILQINDGVSATSGPYADATGWFDNSSRELKENINSLTNDEALRTLNELDPVKYNYKSNKKEGRVGFIAEDVPELVAVNGRKHLKAMDIVAVLTKVVQQQQKAIQKQQKSMQVQQETITQLKKEIDTLKKKNK